MGRLEGVGQRPALGRPLRRRLLHLLEDDLHRDLGPPRDDGQGLRLSVISSALALLIARTVTRRGCTQGDEPATAVGLEARGAAAMPRWMDVVVRERGRRNFAARSARRRVFLSQFFGCWAS